MPVYVDTMRAKLGRMRMSHMIADNDAELHAMADRIGVRRCWHQAPGTPRSHYDICQSKRDLAIRAGAVVVSTKQAGAMCRRRAEEGVLGRPEDALDWYRAWQRR